MRPPRSGRIATAHRFAASLTAAPMLALVLLSACAPRSAGPVHPSPTPLAAVQTPPDSSSPDPTPTATPTPSHVFVIVMENRSYSQAITGRYTSQLAAQYGVATNYRGVSHPSLPNYLALTAGSTFGITKKTVDFVLGTAGINLNASGTDRSAIDTEASSCSTSPSDAEASSRMTSSVSASAAGLGAGHNTFVGCNRWFPLVPRSTTG